MFPIHQITPDNLTVQNANLFSADGAYFSNTGVSHDFCCSIQEGSCSEKVQLFHGEVGTIKQFHFIV